MKKNPIMKKRFSCRKAMTILLILISLQVSAGSTLTERQTRSEASQLKKITGTVKDNAGNPIPGATVLVKGTTNGTTADANGRFTISNLSPGNVLLISFVGMKTIEFKIGSQNTIDAILAEDSIGLEEVVAVGYST